MAICQRIVDSDKQALAALAARRRAGKMSLAAFEVRRQKGEIKLKVDLSVLAKLQTEWTRLDAVPAPAN